MTIIDQVLVPAALPVDAPDQHGTVPYLQALGHHLDLNLFTDQPARHRVGVGAEADRAPLSDADRPAMPGVHAAWGQWAQPGPFLGEPLRPAPVALAAEVPQELLVVGPGGEVAAPAEHQRLSDGRLEPVMTLFDVSILMGLAGRD